MEVKYEFKPSVDVRFLNKHLAALIFPNLSKSGLGKKIKKMDAVLATIDGKAIGLALSTPLQNQENIRLMSLAVSKSFRRQGIATKMITILEKELIKKGGGDIIAYYRSHWSSAEFIPSLFTKIAWSDPKEDMVILQGRVTELYPIYEDIENHLPLTYTISQWSDFMPRNKDVINRIIKEEKVPTSLNPFIASPTLNHTISQVLLLENQIIGWISAHNISPNTIEYTSLYISKKHRKYKLALQLMRSAVLNQMNLDERDQFIAISRKENKVMSHFLYYLAKKTELSIKKVFQMKKILQ